MPKSNRLGFASFLTFVFLCSPIQTEAQTGMQMGMPGGMPGSMIKKFDYNKDLVNPHYSRDVLSDDAAKRLDEYKRALENNQIIVDDGPEIPGTPLPQPPANPFSNVPPWSRLDAPAGRSSDTAATISPQDLGQSQRIDEAFDPRIVGGEPVSINEYPWQVILINGESPPFIRVPFCGGSIIGFQWILTAAHCFKNISHPSKVAIVSGSTWPKFPNEGNRVAVSEIIIHPQWTPSTWENDIALLRLTESVKLGQRVMLPRANFTPQANDKVEIAGWGAVTSWSPMSDQLMRAFVPIVSRDECNKTESYNGIIKENMICAGYRPGGVDACQGDSGGSAVARIKGEPVQIAIISFGKGCALKLKYGVYTAVAPYIKWIGEQIKPNTILSQAQ